MKIGDTFEHEGRRYRVREIEDGNVKLDDLSGDVIIPVTRSVPIEQFERQLGRKLEAEPSAETGGRDAPAQQASEGGDVQVGRIETAIAPSIPAGPILLEPGSIPYIERKHGAQIRANGYESVEQFVQDVVGSHNRIYQGRENSLLLARTNGKPGVAFIELRKAGDGWRVNTAFVARQDYLAGKKLLWERAQATQPPRRPPSAISGQSEPSTDSIPQDSAGWGDSNKVVTKDAYEAALKKLRDKLSANPIFDPELLSASVTVAGFHIEAGARSFADFASRMVRDVGDAVIPYLKSAYNGARDLPGMEAVAREMTPAADVSAMSEADIRGILQADRSIDGQEQAAPTDQNARDQADTPATGDGGRSAA